ncbi:VOC family protein [Novosphingobium rosa]|uniref:VOC family protein n=1 Tax=Novosphingobium rosa TaxID=76978 RepID=UPI00082A47D2|nr:VOC family protein [Novosphingobium rosa]
MMITGVDAVTFGVTDLAEARAYLADWGLAETPGPKDKLLFSTRDGSEVVVRHNDDPALPSAMQAGPTLRMVVWGVDDETTIPAIAARLGEEARWEDGLLLATDPNGLTHGFRPTRRVAVEADAQDVNGPGVHRRVDQRSPVYERAVPISIGHVVLFVDNLEKTLDFFLKTLGFVVSDSYPGHAAFLRASTPGPHHSAFVLQRPGKPGLNHVAFTVSNIHEVFGGGLAMSAKGWESDLGPGRHPISSAYFWYFKSPFGGSLEYYADDDWCTENWVAGEFERTPNNFTEWAIAGGIDGKTRRQSRAA